MQKTALIILLALANPFSFSSAAKRKPVRPSQDEYYVFGIVSVPPKTVDAIQKAYGVRVINGSCILDKDKLAKNKVVDSLMLARHSKSMAQLLREMK